MDYKENKQFDRIETSNLHIYNNNRGFNGVGETVYSGFIKCKLVHNDMFSVIVPDLLYIMDDTETFSWFQFYSFLPNQLTKISDDEIIGVMYVDIAFGHTLQVKFSNNQHITNFEDHSNLFQCEFKGPHNLHAYSTGKGKIVDDTPYITLYHHTTSKTKVLIEDSAFYKGSLWNFQGTKKLKNISYSYFTSLNEIKRDQDLILIAMASNGVTYLLVDITLEPVKITIYREDTKNRRATLEHLINTTIILNNHLWMHTHDTKDYVYYEVCSPFIYRIGLDVNGVLPFIDNTITRSKNVKVNDHIILGDSTTKLGLIAPFDEEFTSHIFKIEPFYNKNTNILNFWFDNMNSDLYTSKKIQRPNFND